MIRMWFEPRPMSPYRSWGVRVYLARIVVGNHTARVATPCPHCWEPDGTERVACPLLRDAIRVLLDYGRPPRHWHPADAL